MKRALALILALMMALSLVACGGDSNNANTNEGGDTDAYYEWSLSCEYSEDNHQTKALKDAAQMIEEQTNGHIKITVYPNMALGDYTVVYGQVMTGDIQMCANPISPQYDPRVDVINMPFLASTFDEFESNYLSKDSYMWKLFDEVTSGGGVKLLGFFNAGFMGLGMKSVDSESFADLTGTATKSQLMRCPAADSYNLTMKAMGFNTTVIPYSDLYSALQNGLCEGWLGGSGLVNYDSFRDAIKYFVDCNVINECIPVMMNAKLFDSLPEEYQTIIVDVFAQMQTRVNEERAEQEAKAVEDMTAYGITVIQPTADELAALRDRIRAEVWPQMANTLGQDVIDNLCQTYNVSLS
ncbi:TRAP transporter substrate-binding protein DctP [uncultured Gemmiger sp.]|uniref:TRAP transporter substrate-binding protein DctP n=1 Tax=uncultured Gemmiger sp. TaxID=1623490 RepID=UPI0025DA4391|nr:TRAP transporter substrate-binding protein DctP [uncultured Gemmiger sp.]